MLQLLQNKRYLKKVNTGVKNRCEFFSVAASSRLSCAPLVEDFGGGVGGGGGS